MTRPLPIVAIDGPAGAGKSTVTRRVAERLGYLVLDTGALYRCVALSARNADISWDDEARLSQLTAELARRAAIEFRANESGGQSVWLNGEDVTLAIRTQVMSEGASRVSAIPGVRAALLALQRGVGERGGVVVEGRDIGSVVFPEAEAKFFLTASVEVRAQRRLAELLERGTVTQLENVMREVRERDARDANRAIAPLVRAPDSILVDSSEMSLDQVVETIANTVETIASRAVGNP